MAASAVRRSLDNPEDDDAYSRIASPSTIGVAVRVNPAIKGRAATPMAKQVGSRAPQSAGLKGKHPQSFSRTHSTLPAASLAPIPHTTAHREGHVRTHCDGAHCHVTDVASGAPSDRFTFDWCFDAANANVLAVSDVAEDTDSVYGQSDAPAAGLRKLEQEEVFDSVVAPLLADCMGNHINGCILAYGQTGSGKTYTMFGTAAHPGIVPRALRSVFQGVAADCPSAPAEAAGPAAPHRLPKTVVRVSLVEVYLEKVTCLLSSRTINVCERPIPAPGGASAIALPLKAEAFFEDEPRTSSVSSAKGQVMRSPDKPQLRAGGKTTPGAPKAALGSQTPSLCYASPAASSQLAEESLICVSAPAFADQTVLAGCYTPGARVLEIHSDKLQPGEVDGVIATVLRSVNNRHCRSTASNERSSRSHVVVSLEIVRTGEAQSLPTSDGVRLVYEQNACVIRFVDLAGNERFDYNASNDEQLKETKAINKSLAALNKVLHEIARRATSTKNAAATSSDVTRLLRSESVLDDVVPTTTRAKSLAYSFRESVLTRLLQDCIAGNCRTTMIATVVREAPRMDSINTLRYADATRTIPSHWVGNRPCWVTASRTIRTAPAEVEKKPCLQRSERLPSPAPRGTSLLEGSADRDHEGVRTPPTARTAKDASPNATLSEFDPAVLSMDSTMVVSDSGSDPSRNPRPAPAEVSLPLALQPQRHHSDTSDKSTLSPHSPLPRQATDLWRAHSKDLLVAEDEPPVASLGDASRLIRLETLLAFQEALARCQETNRRLTADKAELERRCALLQGENERLEEAQQRSLSDASELSKIYRVVLDTHRLVAQGPPHSTPTVGGPEPVPCLAETTRAPSAASAATETQTQTCPPSGVASPKRGSERQASTRSGLSARRHLGHGAEPRGANGGSVRVSSSREEARAATVSQGPPSGREQRREVVALERKLQDTTRELSQVRAKAAADVATEHERYLAASAEVSILHVQLQHQAPRLEGCPEKGGAYVLPKWLTEYLDREDAHQHHHASHHAPLAESISGMWDDDQLHQLRSLLHRLVDTLKLTVLNTKSLNLHKLMELVNKVKLKQDALLQTAMADLRRLTKAPSGHTASRWPLAPNEVYLLSHWELQQAASACQMLVVWHDARRDFLQGLSTSLLTELVANGDLLIHLAASAVDPSSLLFAATSTGRRNSVGVRSAASTARKEASPVVGEPLDSPLTFSRGTSLQRLSRRSEEPEADRAPSPSARSRPASYHSLYDPISHREQVLPLTEKESDAEAAAAQFGSLHSIPCVHLH